MLRELSATVRGHRMARRRSANDAYNFYSDGGRDRCDVDYNWPTTLRVPPDGPKLVYLDLNHWVSLAKALSGHRDGDRYSSILAACQTASEERYAVFPVSASIYMEISKMRQYRQRCDLRRVIERLSGYVAVPARSVILSHEIETLLDSLVGPNPRSITSMDYLGCGVNWALGLRGFRVMSPEGRDVTEEERASHPHGPAAFDALFAAAELRLSRHSIDGSAPSDEAEFEARGNDRLAVSQVAEARAFQEVEQVARFNDDSRWRRSRVRDVIAAREILIEISDPLWEGFADRHAHLPASPPPVSDLLDTVFPEPAQARRGFDSMPSFDVSVSLKTSYHRDPNHRWTSNDMHDIDALSSTLPYCDIVVTDKAMTSHAERTGLADRLNTIVLSRLSDLVGYLR